MSMYLEQIKQLVVLQEVDDKILVDEQELEDLPRRLEELEARCERVKEDLAVTDDKVTILESQRKKMTFEIEENTATLKKSKNKLMMAANTREYHAMMREIDNLEKMNQGKEEENVTLLEALQVQQEEQGVLTAEFAKVEEELKTRQAGIKKETAAIKKRLSGHMTTRKKACSVIPAPVLGRYEFIRSRISNPVIVPVDNGVCGGCHIQVPPQVFHDLQKGEQIISCPNCRRLTYWCEHFEDNKKEDEEKTA